MSLWPEPSQSPEPPQSPGPPLPVVASLDEACALVAAGRRVVLVTPADTGTLTERLPPVGLRPFLMIGDPDDPAVMAAAREMAAELGARLGSQVAIGHPWSEGPEAR